MSSQGNAMALLLRRRAIMGEQKVDAWILDYVQTTGTQWLYTDVAFNGNTDRVIFKGKYSVSSSRYITGSYISSTNRALLATSSLLVFAYAYPTYVRFSTSSTEWQTVDLDFYSGIASTTLNDGTTEVDSFTPRSSPTIDNNRLFVMEYYSTSGYIGYCSNFKQYTYTDTLTVDLFACEQLDGTVCMWDSVSNTFKLNQGSGNFIGGEKIGYVKNGIAYNMDGTKIK